MDNMVALGQAYMADITPLRERPRYFAQLESVINFTQCIGPLVGGILSKVDLYIPLYLFHVSSSQDILRSCSTLFRSSTPFSCSLNPFTPWSKRRKSSPPSTESIRVTVAAPRSSIWVLDSPNDQPQRSRSESKRSFWSKCERRVRDLFFSMFSSRRDGANEEREAHDELPDRDRDYRRVLQQVGVQHLRHGGFSLRHGALPARRLHVRRDELHRQSRQHSPDRLALHLPHPQGLLHPHHGFLGRHCGR